MGPTRVAVIAGLRASTGFGRATRADITRRLPILGNLIVAGVLVLLPLIELERLAMRNGARGYSTAVDSPYFWETIRTTLMLALASVVIAVVLGTTLAWFATLMPPRLAFLRIFPVLPIVLPGIASVAGWTFLLAPRTGLFNRMLRATPLASGAATGPIDVYTVHGIIIITGLSLSAFAYLFVSAGLRGVDPAMLESARTSGSSTTAAFFKVIVPLLGPSLLYGTTVTLLLGIGQFIAPLLLGRDEGIRVITTEVYRYLATSPTDFGAAAALATPIVAIGIVVVVAQRVHLGDGARFVSQGARAFRPPVGRRASLIAAIIVGGFGLVVGIMPLAIVAVVAVSPFWSGSISPSSFTLKHIREALSDERLVAAIGNSLLYSLVAVVLSLVIGYCVAAALTSQRRSPVLKFLLDIVVALPLGIPAVVLGAGFLFAYSKPPVVLFGTRWALIIVYITIMLPFSTRLILSGMLSLGHSHREASRAAGAGPIRTLVKVMLPMLRPTLGGAAALIFILLTYEFAASALVRPRETQVMGTFLFTRWNDGRATDVAVIALVMAVMTIIGLMVAMLLGGRNALDRL